MIQSVYPFTAIVGQDTAKKALILNVICPSIGGVLLSGEKGTAKSTIVRALSQLMKDMEAVTLPLNATLDRVIGSIKIKSALKYGRNEFEPGILYRAHNNILYIDEVNLLSRSIYTAITDSIASGINVVEREGISHTHACRFILAGSMNPEEGGISPQLLDRFGLFVHVKGCMDEVERIEIIKRRLEYEKSQSSFYGKYLIEEENLVHKIREAQNRFKLTSISEKIMQRAADLCIQSNTNGHRADIIIALTARAICAWESRNHVILKDIEEAARLVLPHRLNNNTPNEKNEPKENKKPDKELEKNHKHNLQENTVEMQPQLSGIDPEEMEKNKNKSSQDQDKEEIFEIGKILPVPEISEIKTSRRNRGKGSGRRNKTRTNSRMGRYVKSCIPNGEIHDIALDATLRAAVPYQRFRDKKDLMISIHSGDFREKVREKRIGSTILFLVDASGSMGAGKRMKETKGAVMSLLQEAYQKRDTIGMMAFRKNSAELILPPTRSVERAHKMLKELPVGGRTPLALGLSEAVQLIKRMQVRDRDILPVVVILSDGRCNVPLKKNAVIDLTEIAGKASYEDIRFIVIDTESGWVRLGCAKKLAEDLKCEYINLERIESLAKTIKKTIMS